MSDKVKKNEDKELNLVKKTCKELGITQKELAEKIGVSVRTLTNWNNGTIEIPKIAVNFMNMLPLERDYQNLKKALSKSLDRSF
jgi:transcriptional regulator with XRE-family HTH domain